MGKSVHYRWKILAMTYACMLSFAMVFQSVPPLLGLIIQEFCVGHAQAGLLMSLFALPGIFIALPGGIISDRFGTKKVGVASTVLMIVGTIIVGTSNAFLQASVGRIISGIGGLTLAIVLPQLVSKWFSGKELGIGMGVFNTAMPLGTIVSFNLFSILSKSLGWKTPFFLTTAASAIALLIFLWLFKEPTEKKTEKGRSSVIGDITRLGAPIWLVGLSWMWFNAAFVSFLTFASSFFETKGYEISSAGSMSSIVMTGSLFLSPLVGYSVYKFGKEEAFIGVGGILVASLIFFVPTSPSVISVLVLIGISAALVPAPVFSLPSKTVKPKTFGLAFGIVTACLNIGVLLGPFLAGLARDLTGDYNMSFSLMSLFAVLQTLTIGAFRFLRARE